MVKFQALERTLIIKACGSILLKCDVDIAFQKKATPSTPLRKFKNLQIKFLANKFRKMLATFQFRIFCCPIRNLKP